MSHLPSRLRDFEKVRKVILSCVTVRQYINAKKMVRFWREKHGVWCKTGYYYSDTYYDELRDLCDRLLSKTLGQ